MNVQDMKTIHVTPEDMEQHIARLDSMEPQAQHYDGSSGIPKDLYEAMAVKNLYLMMAPASQGGPMALNSAIKGDSGLSVILVDCEPGDSPLLHGHFKTMESFMCLSGEFRIQWGDEGEYETVLKPFDLIAVPKGVCRSFCNISDENAKLLVIIHGQKDEDFNDVGVAPVHSRWVKNNFGDEAMNAVRKAGTQFLGLEVEDAKDELAEA